MGTSDVVEVSGRVFRLVVGLADKAQRIAFLLFVSAAITGVVGWVLGLIATSGAWRTLWLVVGGLFAVVGIGAGFRSWRALSMVMDQAGTLKDSFVGLIGSVVDAADDLLGDRDVDEMGLVRRANLTRKLRKRARGYASQYADATAAMTAVGTFPAMALTATISTIGFGILAVLFAIAIAV